ncbi:MULTISPECIES: hypothetical protein [Desulfofundulus]|uniref:DUF3311 domain-containing protein n=1 Tax=Desulfofundulus luciae TaxID=74702 RepID=A0ABU0B3J9_9FIRM|nr:MULTISPECIES: hypothetical protein [Desulfofundulus]MCS5695046.1 hypothetical protein [Desulfofundulus thermocisternus]MDQ0287299.1 hypothetical protein [Desulfofundulus luciae]
MEKLAVSFCLLLLAGVVIAFSPLFWSSRVVYHIPLLNWGFVFLVFYAVILAGLFTWLAKKGEDKIKGANEGVQEY